MKNNTEVIFNVSLDERSLHSRVGEIPFLQIFNAIRISREQIIVQILVLTLPGAIENISFRYRYNADEELPVFVNLVVGIVANYLMTLHETKSLPSFLFLLVSPHFFLANTTLLTAKPLAL